MKKEYTLDKKYKLIKEEVTKSKEKNPINLLKTLMHEDYINIHGPEHHFLDGAVFMAALYNNGLDFNLEKGLEELEKRTIRMPGAMCGFWGVCGSITSLGAVFSIIDGTGPLSNSNDYANHMKYTSNVIQEMSEIGGPRCCKRNAFISIKNAVDYANEFYNLNIEIDNIFCEFSSFNQQCLKKVCPFYNLFDKIN